jgi:hypothetical protein
MKKLFAIALMGVVATSMAFASTVGVPFFSDNYSDGALPPAGAVGQFASYVGLKNNTTDDITLTVQYFAGDGTEVEADNGGTYVLPAGSGVGVRPVEDEGGTAPDFPDMTTGTAGAMLVTYFGKRGDITGRILTLAENGQSAYLLPTGPEER